MPLSGDPLETPRGFLRPGMRSMAHQFLPDAQSLGSALAQIGTLLHFHPLGVEEDCYQFVGQLSLNDLPLLSYSGAGIHCEMEPHQQLILAACFEGSRRVQDPQGELTSSPGGAVLLPVGAGRRTYSSSAAASAVAVSLDPGRLAQVAAAMGGRPGDPALDSRGFSHCGLRAFPPPEARLFHALLSHIDDCAELDPQLPGQLGLDDVLLRLVALKISPALLAERQADGARLQGRGGSTAFDELIDDIRANLDQPLRLSDLEARSFYSRRSLQYAFRERLGTTPRQWIREQRLVKAMETLQSQPPGVPLRAIALACGYRHFSQFSTDFKRRFGLTPSQVRRPELR